MTFQVGVKVTINENIVTQWADVYGYGEKVKAEIRGLLGMECVISEVLPTAFVVTITGKDGFLVVLKNEVDKIKAQT